MHPLPIAPTSFAPPQVLCALCAEDLGMANSAFTKLALASGFKTPLINFVRGFCFKFLFFVRSALASAVVAPPDVHVLTAPTGAPHAAHCGEERSPAVQVTVLSSFPRLQPPASSHAVTF